MITLAMIITDSNKHGEQVDNSWWNTKGCAKGGIFQMISLVTESENLKLIDVVSDHKGIREMDSKREKEKKKGKIGQERIIEDESREETFFTDVHAAAMLVAN